MRLMIRTLLIALFVISIAGLTASKATLAETPATTAKSPRTDLQISGVYPHLTTYGIYSQDGAHTKSGHNECGIGAIVPWAGKLWMVNYAPHAPGGSEHKLYSVDPDLTAPLVVHPESVGGTPAGRMIHKESNQLFIAHYAIDSRGKVRAISPREMPIRVTAIARHLTDPANFVYFIDMEGSIWEANVHTLKVQRLFKKPVPGWHGKGGYTSQGRLVVSNNGELHVGNYNDLLVGAAAKNEEERGVLAEYDGKDWKIIERRQFTEVTGPRGITGGSDGDEPVWAIGWDRRSLRLKVLEAGKWSTYLLPKAAFCNDAKHGWYTEWPRIREVTGGRWMMDMHGMFFDFPQTFSRTNSGGLKPIGSHLRYVPDFCVWNDSLVLASDETSIQGNKLAGQPQSNLWFGKLEELETWGPANGYGGPWVEDRVVADSPSDPFLIAGFNRRVVHLAVGRKQPTRSTTLRASDQQEITQLPKELAGLTRVALPRGDWHKPAPGFSFRVNQPVTVFLAVDRRGDPELAPEWKPTKMQLKWGRGYLDTIYERNYAAGEILIPGNDSEHQADNFGMPHLVFVRAVTADKLTIIGKGNASVVEPTPVHIENEGSDNVIFTLELDVKGNGQWQPLDMVSVPAAGYTAYALPSDLTAQWLRFKVNRDCIATAYLHQTTSRFIDGAGPENVALFAGLADVSDRDALAARIYPAKRNRNLRVITGDNRHFDFTKTNFDFQSEEPDADLDRLLRVEPEFSVDAASVMIANNGRRWRLPKGDVAFDKPFASGHPRAIREVESERVLANIHGTFYELPLITNGAPPNFGRMRPVSSHSKQITDFCSWNGLLVLAGVRSNAKNDGHVFANPDQETALWFGGVDDLWKLGKPVGTGGPWRNTAVQAGVPSDPYLMTGYDQKSVVLSHAGKEAVEMLLQVDIDGTGLWVDYRSFAVSPGQEQAFTFPAGFSAHWVRAVSNRNVSATVQFRYQ